MKINLDSPSDDIRIEIVPLIDVIFCILTFFILAALQFTRQQAINVDLPKASSSNTPIAREMLLVSINPFNQIYVENQLVLPDELEQKLREYRQQRPDGMMVLYASKTAFYNDVVQVLDKMRAVGGDRVSLATLPDTPNQVPDGSTPVSPGTGMPGVTPLPPGLNPPATGTPGVTPLPPGLNTPGTLSPGLNPYSGSNPPNPYNPYSVPSPGQSTLPGLNPSVPGSAVPTPGGVPEPPTGVERGGASSTPEGTRSGQ